MDQSSPLPPRTLVTGAFAVLTIAWAAFTYLPRSTGVDGDLITGLMYDGWAVLMALVAVVHQLRAREPIWWPVTGAVAALVTGDILWDLSDRGLIPTPNDTPSLMDLFYLPAYVAMGLTVVLLLRRYQRGAGLGRGLELVVVGAGAVTVVSPVLVNRFAEYPGSGLGRVLETLYPACDLLLLAGVVTVIFASPGVRPLRLIALAAACCTAADLIYSAQLAAGTYTGTGWLDWLWLAQFTCMALAVLSPLPPPAAGRDAGRDADRNADRDRPESILGHRTALLVLAAVANPAMLVYTRFFVSEEIRERDEGTYVVVSLVLVALVCLRLVCLLRENEGTVRRLRAAVDASDRLTLEMDHQVNHDAVTGLPNRRGLAARAGALVREQPGEHAVVFVDLDDFTAVNDVVGHAAGDLVLRELGRRLEVFAGEGLAARLGADEFAVLLPGAGAGGRATAQRLVELIGEPLVIGGRTVRVGAHAGVAVLDPADPLSGLLQADVAMYAAKRGEGGRVVAYSDGMREQVLGDAGLAADLVRAVAGGELEVAYQPIVQLGSRRTVTVEALVRWRHHERGFLPPDTFLPIAVVRGIVADIDLFVLDAALGRLGDWRLRAPHLRVAVNASAQLLSRDDVVDRILGLLELHGLPGEALVLEVTEQSMVDDPVRTARSLQALRDRGVGIALDDFGTGYSSLSYLQQLPVDVLKLDRSFITRGVVAGQLTPLLRMVIALGRELGLVVVAEGVETHQQWEALRDAGCDRGQGWLFAKPLPPQDVPAYVERDQASGATLDPPMTPVLR